MTHNWSFWLLPTDLDIGTLELSDERSVPLEDGNVKPISMTVANQNVSSVADVDAVRIVGHDLAADAVQKLPVLVEHHHTVTLPPRTTSDN